MYSSQSSYCWQQNLQLSSHTCWASLANSIFQQRAKLSLLCLSLHFVSHINFCIMSMCLSPYQIYQRRNLYLYHPFLQLVHENREHPVVVILNLYVILNTHKLFHSLVKSQSSQAWDRYLPLKKSVFFYHSLSMKRWKDHIIWLPCHETHHSSKATRYESVHKWRSCI